MKSYKRNLQTYTTPVSLNEYESYLESFNWKDYLSSNYHPFLEEIINHMQFLAEQNGSEWIKKYQKIQEKYSKMYKKVS
jgi:hypothetical protein